jgi:hypothetical protein
MKVGDLRSVLEILAEALSNPKLVASVSSLRELSKMLDPIAGKGMLDLEKILSRLDTAVSDGGSQSVGILSPAVTSLWGGSGSQTIGVIVPAVTSLYKVFSVAGKASDAAQLKQLLESLSRNSNVSLSALTELIRSPPTPRRPRAPAGRATGSRRPRAPAGPPNMTLVNDYLRRLEATLGKDDKFMAVYEELKNDKDMAKPEMAELANLFMGPVRPTTTRPKALETILSRHRKIVDFV